MTPAATFLRAALGPPAAALERLARTTPAVGAVLLPRAVAAWIQAAPRSGPVPGVPGSDCYLAKTETGWSGHVRTEEFQTTFENAPLPRAMAAVLVALGATPTGPTGKDVDLARFGRTVDLLAKAQTVRRAPPPPAAERVYPVTAAELARPCGTCGAPQALGTVAVMCHCLADLVKHTRLEAHPDGLRLVLGEGWDAAAVGILTEALGRG